MKLNRTVIYKWYRYTVLGIPVSWFSSCFYSPDWRLFCHLETGVTRDVETRGIPEKHDGVDAIWCYIGMYNQHSPTLTWVCLRWFFIFLMGNPPFGESIVNIFYFFGDPLSKSKLTNINQLYLSISDDICFVYGHHWVYPNFTTLTNTSNIFGSLVFSDGHHLGQDFPAKITWKDERGHESPAHCQQACTWNHDCEATRGSKSPREL